MSVMFTDNVTERMYHPRREQRPPMASKDLLELESEEQYIRRLLGASDLALTDHDYSQNTQMNTTNGRTTTTTTTPPPPNQNQ